MDSSNSTNFTGEARWSQGLQLTRASPAPPHLRDMKDLEKDLRPMFYAFAYTALILALLGNCLIIVIVAFDRQSRSMANLFLVNISIADVFYAAFNIVGESLYVAWEETPQKIEDNICPLTSIICLRFLAYTVSMLSLAALSIERYHAVCKPLTTYTNIANLNILKIGIFVFIWLASIAISVPIGMCPFEGNVKVFAIALVLLLHTIPLLIIITTNTIILASRRSHVRVNIGVGTTDVNRRRGRARSKLTTLLFLMVITFIVFWSPYHVFFLYSIFKQFRLSQVNYFKLIIAQRAANVFTYFNPALNPILYIILGTNFRQGFNRMIHRGLAAQQNRITFVLTPTIRTHLERSTQRKLERDSGANIDVVS